MPEGARVYLHDQGLKDLSSCQDALRPDVVDYLNLDRNQLTNVDAVASLTGLKWLRLNENRLAALPDLSGLKKLRRVYLRNNKFTQVPETLKDLPELTDLDLSWNDVTEVPDWLAKREILSRAAERLQVAYTSCVARLDEPASDVTIPIERHPDGSVKASVTAKQAQVFPVMSFLISSRL